MGVENEEVCLNGFGAILVKSLGDAQAFQIFMRRHFKGKNIDFNNLTWDEQKIGYNCYGYSDAARYYLTDNGISATHSYRKYVFEFSYNRFPENMNYADALVAYRWRTHNCNLSSIENNCIFLYNPILAEAGRKLSPDLRKNGKAFFDIMWKVNPGLCFEPFENRKYEPMIYENFPEKIKRIFSEIVSIEGSIVSENQTNFFNTLLPFIRNNLIDLLPDQVFELVNRDAIIDILKKDLTFGKNVFALINLYGVAQWYKMIGEFNSL